MSVSKKNQPYTSKLRGVSILLGEEDVKSATPAELNGSVGNQVLSIQVIHLPSRQPRRYFDEEKLRQLTDSVKAHGILEPLLVRVLEGGRYELIAGERRYRAAKAAGLTEVPVVVKHLTDDEAWQIALIENLQREDLNPIEETEGMLSLLSLRLQMSVDDVTQRLHRMQNEAKGKVTQNVLGNPEGDLIQRIFAEVGSISWESFVSSRLPLLKMPQDVLEAVQQGKIAYTKAQAIARVKENELRRKLLKQAISKDLSLSQIKNQITQFSDSATSAGEDSRGEATPSLSQRLTQVSKAVSRSTILSDPRKIRKLDKLITELETLLETNS